MTRRTRLIVASGAGIAACGLVAAALLLPARAPLTLPPVPSGARVQQPATVADADFEAGLRRLALVYAEEKE